MKFTIAFSPCPNDTFIFDALINKKIDTGGLEFEAILEDVETLNKWALEGKHAITKLSFPAFFNCTEHYVLLNSGSALGKGVGPLVISNKENEGSPSVDSSIALPGENTTANLLFSFAYPACRNKKFMIFSDIEDAVLSNMAEYGVIIHENRFTYQEKGLQKLADLGEYWEQKKKLPIPLGGIAFKRSIGTEMGLKVESLIKASLEYAFKKYPFVSDFVKMHSQSMSEDVMRQHINLYVNDYSLDLMDEGRKAINSLREVFMLMNPGATNHQNIFLDNSSQA